MNLLKRFSGAKHGGDGGSCDAIPEDVLQIADLARCMCPDIDKDEDNANFYSRSVPDPIAVSESPPSDFSVNTAASLKLAVGFPVSRIAKSGPLVNKKLEEHVNFGLVPRGPSSLIRTGGNASTDVPIRPSPISFSSPLLGTAPPPGLDTQPAWLSKRALEPQTPSVLMPAGAPATGTLQLAKRSAGRPAPLPVSLPLPPPPGDLEQNSIVDIGSPTSLSHAQQQAQVTFKGIAAAPQAQHMAAQKRKQVAAGQAQHAVPLPPPPLAPPPSDGQPENKPARRLISSSRSPMGSGKEPGGKGSKGTHQRVLLSCDWSAIEVAAVMRDVLDLWKYTEKEAVNDLQRKLQVGVDDME